MVESLIIGGLQGLMNYAGVSVLDKLKVKKLQSKIADGSATAAECLKAFSILQKDKDASSKISSCCTQLIQHNKHLTIANTYQGMVTFHTLFNSKSSLSTEQILASEAYKRAKEHFEKADATAKDEMTTDFSGIRNRINAVDTYEALTLVIGLKSYYQGFLYHLEGDVSKAQASKETGLSLNRDLKGALPY